VLPVIQIYAVGRGVGGEGLLLPTEQAISSTIKKTTTENTTTLFFITFIFIIQKYLLIYTNTLNRGKMLGWIKK
jgi:hypothetical protein